MILGNIVVSGFQDTSPNVDGLNWDYLYPNAEQANAYWRAKILVNDVWDSLQTPWILANLSQEDHGVCFLVSLK